MRVPISTSVLYTKTAEAAKTYRAIIHEGGARAGKTYAIAQYFITRLLQERGKTLTIVRKSGTALHMSAERDVIEILVNMGLYHEENHDKTRREYTLFGNRIEFTGIDNPQKKRGSKRNYLWCNEANELEYDDFMQLAMRTTELIVLDYNPSDEFHWIYDHVETRPDATLIRSTYLDNPFLEDAVVNELEALKNVDENAYRVFTLGERAHIEGRIYTNWTPAETFAAEHVVHGLDFGYTNQTALVRVGRSGTDIYAEQRIYRANLTNADIITLMRDMGVRGPVYCDAAEPQRIEEIRRAGFDARPADKAVKPGIDFLRAHRLCVVNSPDLEREVRQYKWRQDRSGRFLDEPVKFMDHALDALRYGAYTAWGGAPPAAMQYTAIRKRERATW